MKVETRTEIAVRPYRAEDEAEVLELLQASLGGGPAGTRSAEFFRWKHIDNPFGRSLMLLAEADGRIAGLRAFMRWRFATGDREILAVRAVDTATHPDYQGRGIFSRLTLAALAEMQGDVDLVFNTPNEKSLPGYLKMGWSVVGKLPVSLRIRRPVRFARRIRSLRLSESARAGPPIEAVPAIEALRAAEGLSILTKASHPLDGRLATSRTPEYLKWRYADAPLLDYRAIVDDQSEGIAFFRVRSRGELWESSVADLVVPEGDRAAASRLLRRVVAAARVDHVTCSFPLGTTPAAALRRAGFLPGPRVLTFVANPLSGDLRPDPLDMRSWALSLGDLEVF
jgi:GNAT superfamily N-acetyltransferase